MGKVDGILFLVDCKLLVEKVVVVLVVGGFVDWFSDIVFVFKCGDKVWLCIWVGNILVNGGYMCLFVYVVGVVGEVVIYYGSYILLDFSVYGLGEVLELLYVVVVKVIEFWEYFENFNDEVIFDFW